MLGHFIDIKFSKILSFSVFLLKSLEDMLHQDEEENKYRVKYGIDHRCLQRGERKLKTCSIEEKIINMQSAI